MEVSAQTMAVPHVTTPLSIRAKPNWPLDQSSLDVLQSMVDASFIPANVSVTITNLLTNATSVQSLPDRTRSVLVEVVLNQ